MAAKGFGRFTVAAAMAIVFVAISVSAPAQVFSPDGSKQQPVPKGPASGPSAGSPNVTSTEKLCDELQAKIKALPKPASKNKSVAADCAAGGEGVGVLRVLRVITEVCYVGGAEMNATMMKFFDNIINGAREQMAKECN
jgi:hypothetical protein